MNLWKNLTDFNLKRFIEIFTICLLLSTIGLQSYFIRALLKDCKYWAAKYKEVETQKVEAVNEIAILKVGIGQIYQKNEELNVANKGLAEMLEYFWIENGALQQELKRVKKNRQAEFRPEIDLKYKIE